METNFSGQYYYGTGRRKSAVARVRLYKGKGDQVLVNGQKGTKYFNPAKLLDGVFEPLELVGLKKDFDISVKVAGGGISGQADAMRHGISRALVAFDANLKSTLKKSGFLTRDSRVKERKKPGLKSARRAPQFSKR